MDQRANNLFRLCVKSDLYFTYEKQGLIALLWIINKHIFELSLYF